jgi:hypothetical protein
MKTLIPCVGCGRHVRVADRGCPFCGADVEAHDSPAVSTVGGRLGRAAIFALGATLAVGAAACGATVVGPDASGDGAAPVSDATPEAGPDDGGSPMARYGAVPAPDAG